MTWETNYRIAYEKFWQDIKNRDPEEIAAARAVEYDSATGRFVVKFFEEEHVADINGQLVYRRADGRRPELTDAIIILNYLAYARPLAPTEPRWVSLKEIPGGMIFYPAFHKTAVHDLIEAFGRQASRLQVAARSLGGKPVALGDSAAVFRAFPEIPLCVAVWEGDDEVPPNATILYDPSVEAMLHVESIIGLGMSLAAKLRALAWPAALPFPKMWR